MSERTHLQKKELLFEPIARQLGVREDFRDEYWRSNDPIRDDRLWWRAQSFRHLVHMLPGQHILELGCGEGRFTRQLMRLTRGENPVTAVSFLPDNRHPALLPERVEYRFMLEEPGALEERQFDFIVSMDLLDQQNCAALLQQVFRLLKPGGQVIFYESNPWNLALRLKRLFGRRQDPRHLLDRRRLYELISELGFIRVFAVYNDFVYAPLSRRLIWLLRNLSTILENTPRIQTLAGSILLRAQKPPRDPNLVLRSLADHPELFHSVSVVIPCYKEEMNIGPLIERLRVFYGDYLHEIIPVDDNSTDNTAEILRRMAADDPRIRPVYRTPPNGVGRAIADGLRAATGKYVLTMDCDFVHLLPELRDLFDAIVNGADVAVGSRFSRRSVLLNYPVQKIIANRTFHALAKLLLRRRFRDLTNNLKLMRREVVDRLELTQPGFAANAETGLQPLLMGFKVKEVPISWINRSPDMGISSFRLVKVGGGYWKVLLDLWKKQRKGYFDGRRGKVV